MGTNLSRPATAKSFHDNLVQDLASWLLRNGYNVLADHISWSAGAPGQYGNHIPDVLSSHTQGAWIFEVEDCTTYSDPTHTKSQLETFANVAGMKAYVVIPKTCYRSGQPYDPVPEMQALITQWGLQGKMSVGTPDGNGGYIWY